MKPWTIRIGRFFGIEVFIHWTFWILLVWIVLLHFRSGSDLSQALWGGLFILALFGCVVLHEFGHALTAARFGVATRDITLYPIGGIASLEEMPERPGQEMLVALAGPAVNFAIAAILWFYLQLTGQIPGIEALSDPDKMTELPFFWSLFLANLILPIFNLIPAFPMDGGRAFRALLSFWMERVKATIVAAKLGQLLAILFVFLGFFYNFWLVFIGLFVYLGAGGEVAHERMKTELSGLTVDDASMRKFTLLRPEEPLSRAVDALLNSQESAFVVLDGDKPVGLLTRNEIIRGLAEHGKDAAVSSFMIREFFTVDSAMPLREFFKRLIEKNQNIAVVVDKEENLVGLIDRENVEEMLLINEALKKSRYT
ncbi:MAG TPA: site-2 protease family protein [Blastocatellia bacterium]|nr:site-2 protease family protein [Blastocatellia bacterium]